MNLTSAIARFARQLAADGRSRHTRAAYRRDLRALAAWLGDGADLRRITPDVLARFLTSDVVLLTSGGQRRAPIHRQPHEVGAAVVLCLLRRLGVD